MDDVSKRIAALSPAKRALLQQILKEKSSAGQKAKAAERELRVLRAFKERPARLPLSYAQQRLWFLDRLEGSSAEYNVREVFRLKGELDCPALERAVNALVARHETLRTRFVEEDGEPRQVIEPALHLAIVTQDLSEMEPAEREREVTAALRSEVEKPFDLSTGPLLRVRLLKLGEREHVLLSTFHHIIFDGWSTAVFNRDLSAFYEAFRSGEDNPLKPLTVQYADYALWQRERLEGEELSRQLAYWKNQLADALVLALPTDLPRPLRPSFAGARHALVLSPQRAARLKELSRQENATLFMTLLAAFQVLLSRYSCQEDISVGIPAVNRNHVELEELIGFFLDTLVLRTDLSGAPSFRELLRRVQKVTLEAYAHAEVPFERLVQELQPERSLNQTPLFQAFLNFLSFEDEPVKLAGLEAERSFKEGLKSKFDLTLYAREGSYGLYLSLAYGTELFLPATIERMMLHFEILLEAIAADPDARIGALPMLTREERTLRKVSEQGIQPAHPYIYFAREEIEQSLAARFASQVQRTPEQPAVRSATCQWTYRELDQRANNVAEEIVRRCGQEEPHIALLFEHDAPMIAATLGVLKSGKACVALDPAYPPARLARMIDDSQARTIITDEANSSLARELAAQGASVWDFQELASRLASEPIALGSAEAMAYLLYTSGSTGEPKAVTQSHRNVLHHIASYTNGLHISAHDRLLLVASLGVDAAVQDIFGALLNGATVCPFDVRRHELGALAQWMAEEEITIFHSTPSLYRYLVAALSEQRRWTFPKLRLVVLGGEMVLPSDIELYKEHFEPGCLLVNGYGLSESTVSLQCFLDMACENAGRSIPIGHPVEETEVLLLNAQGDAGQVCGEIAIASAYLADGYWQHPELTAAAFWPDPDRPGRKIYRTGDLGRLLPNGMIEFLGRRDFQVKIRGYRVECEEIELALSGHPDLAQAAVLPSQNARGEQDLIGYVVPRPERAISSREVREFAAHLLPSYMVPQAIIILESLPLTAGGKINRRALPLPEQVPAEGAPSYVAPATPTEEITAGIWSELLKVEKIGIHDDFFEAGGHSLLATRLVSRIRRAFEVEIPLRAVFEGPTVAALSRLVDASLEQTTSPSNSSSLVHAGANGAKPIKDRPERLPLSYAQQRLWFLDKLEGSSAEYNVPKALRLKGKLDCAAVTRAINALVARHESLRTHFAEDDGEPWQVVEPTVNLSLPIEDLSSLPPDESEQVTDKIMRAEVAKPFDLSEGPLLRLRLLRLGEGEHVLLCTFHHIIFDGWSGTVFNRDLSALYGAFVRGKDNPLRPLGLQYPDYAIWQRERVEGEEWSRQLAYWRRQLSGVSPLALPTDRPRPLRPSFAGAREFLVVSPESTAKLKELGRQENATLFMTLLAAFQLLLARYTGEQDISVGIPAANRNHLELEELIGFFLDTLVLRTDLSGAPSFRQLLRRVQRVTLEAYAHSELPFEKLVQDLQPERSLNQTPLFQAFLNFLSFEDEPVKLAGLEVERCLKEGVKSKFDLTLYVREGPYGLYLSFAYSTELFLPATIERMARHFAILLEAIVADPDARIGALPMLKPEEHSLHKVSEQAVQPPNSYSYFAREEIEQSIPARFAQQVRKAPEQLAIRTARFQWTYQELDHRSNQIAQGIVRRCGRDEQRIALLLEHDAPMIAATLGVLKSGKAYVALDPAHPLARLSNFVDDARAQTIISDEANAALAQELSAAGISVLSLAELEASSVGEQLPLGSAEATAYLLYTSGSTGEPKAVTQSHRNVLHHIASYTNGLHISAHDRLLLVASLGVDAAVQDIFGALLNGATVCPFDVRRHELGALAQWMAEEEITIFHSTPSLYRYLVAALSEQRRWTFPKLRLVVLGGEMVLPSDIELYKEHFEPGCLLVNGYGLSESTVSLQCFLDMAYENAGGSIPLGTPVEETEVLLLNAQGEPGQVCGEIAIASAYLADGYWRRPELTAAAFLPDRQSPERKVYRTGDLGRLLPNGMIEFLGRRDFQLKIRGYRVECQEIELVLCKHEQVAQAAVVARQNEQGEQELIGYVVPQAGRSISSREVRAFAAQWLPTYMVPQVVLILESLPLTASGKINRKALPLPEDLPGTVSQSYVAPGTPTQETIAEIWRELLKADKLGIHDDFFECGGHSLLATRLVSRVRRAFEVELPLRAVFEGPTIAAMSQLVDALSGADAALIGTTRSLEIATLPERPGRLPLSYAQQRLWFLDKLEGSSAEYNMRKALRLKGELNCPGFERALNALIARHETLRTRLDEEDGEPSQVIEPAGHVPLLVEDLSALEPAERERRVELAMRAEADTPFDLGRGPLLRVRLLKLGEREHILLCTFHHIIFDGWSSAVFSRDLSAFYEAFRRGDDKAPLKPLPVQYADYALWQRERLEGEQLERQLAYWKNQLADAPALALPTDLPRPLRPSFAGGRHSLVLAPEIAARLKELGRQENATLFMTLLAAFQLLLSRYSGQEDISVGIPAANRNHVELEELIGFFLDTLVLRTDLSGAPSFRELLRRVQKVTLEAYAHAEVPFERLVQELQPERTLNQTPLFQAFLNFLSFEDQPMRLVGLETERCLNEGLKSKFDLTLYIREGPYGLYLSLAYSTELFLPATIERMMRHFDILLEAIAADPDARIGTLPLLAPEERSLRKVSEQAVQPANSYSYFAREEIEQSIPARFAQQVRKAPEQLAIRTARFQWTYQELAQRTNRIAHELLRHCGERTQRVALLLAHDAPMVAATLGVLQAGAAYVPLDPGYPMVRLRKMLEDAQVDALITDEANQALAQQLGIPTLLDLNDLLSPPAEGDLVRGSAESMAYLLYTSGSTGEPKAVTQSHRNVLHHIASYTNSLHISAEDRLLLVASLGVDAAVQDIFGALLNGATVCAFDIRNQELSALADWMVQEQITIFHSTPSLFRYFLATLSERRWTFSKLRMVVLGGEKVVSSDWELYRGHFSPGCLLVNGYGLSESTVSLQCFLDANSEIGNRGGIPIGHPVEETEVFLLNEQGEPGQVCGEIAIASAYLADGYWRRPELTAAAFWPDLDRPGRKIYRTGDLGRLLPNGMMEFLGRRDFQVKIRGYRVECEEIEVALCTHAQVANAAVVARQNSRGEQELIAYILAQPGNSLSSRQLRNFASQLLPSYMVPQAILFLKSLPLTSSGKIDRKALPAPEEDPSSRIQSYLAPTTPLETSMAEIWCELLKLDKVGLQDDFFESGGHSLLATRLISRIRRTFEVELPLRAVFETPTVAALAHRVENIRWVTEGLGSNATIGEREEITL